jgi:hypothetical protein
LPIKASKTGRLVETHPGPRRKVRGVTDEPRVLEVICGTGLTGHRPTESRGPFARATLDYAFQKAGREVGNFRGKGIRKLKRGFPEHLSLPVHNTPDVSGTDQDASVCKSSVGRNHLEKAYVENTKGQARVGLQSGTDAQSLRHIHGRLISELQEKVHGGCVK